MEEQRARRGEARLWSTVPYRVSRPEGEGEGEGEGRGKGEKEGGDGLHKYRTRGRQEVKSWNLLRRLAWNNQIPKYEVFVQ